MYTSTILEYLIAEMNKATERAEKAIDDALEFVDASNRRIAEMEMQALASRHDR